MLTAPGGLGGWRPKEASDEQIERFKKEREAEKFKVPPGTTSTDNEADISEGLKLLLTLLPKDSESYVQSHALFSEAAKLKVPPSSIPETTSTLKTPDNASLHRITHQIIDQLLKNPIIYQLLKHQIGLKHQKKGERKSIEALELSPWERETREALQLSPRERETREALPLSPWERETREALPLSPWERETREALPLSPWERETREALPLSPWERETIEALPLSPWERETIEALSPWERETIEAALWERRRLELRDRRKREALDLRERRKREALELRGRREREALELLELERIQALERIEELRERRKTEAEELRERRKREPSELRKRRKREALGERTRIQELRVRRKREASELRERRKREASELREWERIESLEVVVDPHWERETREDLKLLERDKREDFELLEREKAPKLKGPASSEPGTTSTPKAPGNDEQEIQLKKIIHPSLPHSELNGSKVKKEAHYSLYELKAILIVLPEDSKLYKKTDFLIKYSEQSKLPAKLQYSLDDLYQILKILEQVLRQDSKLLKKTKHLIQKLKERCYFSDLTEEQLMSSFGEVRKFRFELYKVFLSCNSVDAKASTGYKRFMSTKYTYDLPNDTAHGTLVGSGHKLFGSIQAAGFSLDPMSPPFNIFNRQFNDPVDVPKLGCLSPHFCHCSIPFSTSVKIAAELYVTTDNMNTTNGYYSYDASEICNDSAVINLSDYFANRPNGGSCSYTLNGRDGYLKLYYVALKYVVDAALEVVFHATSKETKVAGRVMAYYGKNFDYGCSPAEVDDYKAMLFESKQPEVKPGKINLMRPVLSVPAQFSLIIDANLTDSTSGDIILSGVYEFFVPTDGGIWAGCIKGNDCSLELTVDWKLPPLSEETTLAKSSYYSDLTKKQVFSHRSSVTEDEEDVRWSLQKEFSLAFGPLVNACSPHLPRKVSISIPTGTDADDWDYVCTGVFKIRRCPCIDESKLVGLDIKELIGFPPQAGMLERCVVGGPGILKFKLSGTWIAESICEMLKSSIYTWAPELPIKTAIIHILPRNIAKEMHMGHLQSAIIGDALAGVLGYCGVMVRRRFHYGDYLDTESKMMMTEFLIYLTEFCSGEVKDQDIGELEVLYENSKKKFATDAEFRERTKPVQDWDASHESAWERICKISSERYREVYLRLGIRVKEEGETLHDHYVGETRKLLKEKGYNTESEGDEVIVIEGRKLRLVDFAALWHSLEMGKADRIVHVADVGQRDKIEMCINAAESLGWTVTNHCHDPLSHVGFVQVEGFKGIGLVQLLDEAKSRCKAVLVGKGKEVEHKHDRELEHIAKAVVKYEVLKNSRLTDYTFSFDDMLNETGNTAVYLQKTLARISSTIWKSEKMTVGFRLKDLTLNAIGITLKDDRERQLGLHLLRFTEVVGEVCRVLAPHILCDYLFVLCDKFNGLYPDSSKVLSSDDASKILLYRATAAVIYSGLFFLRINPISSRFL